MLVSMVIMIRNKQLSQKLNRDKVKHKIVDFDEDCDD